MTAQSPQAQGKRPAIVWFISIYFFLTAANNLFTIYLSGKEGGRMPEEVKAYYNAMPMTEYGFAVLLGFLTLAGAVALFQLNRASVFFFGATLVGNLALAAWHISTRGLADVWHYGGFGMLFAWAILAGVTYYAYRVTSGDRDFLKLTVKNPADEPSS